MVTVNTALILVDIQIGFNDAVWGKRNNPHAETQVAKLLARWRVTQRPIIHIQHDSVMPNSPLRPNQPGHHFKAEATPLANEPIFHKTVNSSFIGTPLEAHLRQANIGTFVLVGLTTDHCISTTARMGGNLGFKIFLPQDAVATFERIGFNGKHYSAEEIHETALASLHQEFATVVSTDDILAQA
jgi:nicotinamidase-related amidase